MEICPTAKHSWRTFTCLANKMTDGAYRSDTLQEEAQLMGNIFGQVRWALHNQAKRKVSTAGQPCYERSGICCVGRHAAGAQEGKYAGCA